MSPQLVKLTQYFNSIITSKYFERQGLWLQFISISLRDSDWERGEPKSDAVSTQNHTANQSHLSRALGRLGQSRPATNSTECLPGIFR